jgi:hypothetical protein
MTHNPVVWVLGIVAATVIRHYVYRLLRGRR